MGGFSRFGRERGTVGVRVGCAVRVEEGVSFGFSGGLAVVEGSDKRVIEREIVDVRVVRTPPTPHWVEGIPLVGRGHDSKRGPI